ncbi:MAG: Trk system potassium transporter TrkA [Parachlamydiaceae bacterium]|nr:Trk system potassium transporter TrkA [Parachlamydiaceae bacterium]
MNIVIIGAGDIGLFTASALSKQGHNVVLVDKNGHRLSEMAWQMDIAAKKGSGTDWVLLDELLEMKPDLFLALTSQDEVNLMACTLAKHLGYPRTIARVKDSHLLNCSRLDFARLFSTDYLISPELLVAYDIFKYLISLNSIAYESLAHGAVQMRTIRIPLSWGRYDIPLKELKLPKGVMVSLIYRKGHDGKPTIIFPHGDDYILPDDEVTFMGERNAIIKIHQYFNLNTKQINSVVIVGGTLIGINLAKILQDDNIEVHIIDKNAEHCVLLAEEFPKCRITHQEAIDTAFLHTERIGHADFFIMCTKHDETNIMGALVAKEAGCEHVAIVLENEQFRPLVDELGIAQVVSPKHIAAKQILSFATSKAVSSLILLYNDEVEIVEITVSLNCKIIGIPLSDLGPRLPNDFLIAMIQNRGTVIIPKGDSVICPGDVVIVICKPKYFNELEKIF